MRGKRLVNAIPTAALLAIRRCSASRTSGRRSSRVEGRPTGSDSGNFTSSGRIERCITCGYSPAKKAMSFSLTEILRSNSGTNVAVRAYSTFVLLEMTFALLEMTSALLEMTSALLEMTSALLGMTFALLEMTSVPLEMTFALLEMTFALLEMTSALLEMTSALLEMTSALLEILCSDVGGQFGGHGDDTPWRRDDNCRLVSDGTDARLVRCGLTCLMMRVGHDHRGDTVLVLRLGQCHYAIFGLGWRGNGDKNCQEKLPPFSCRFVINFHNWECLQRRRTSGCPNPACSSNGRGRCSPPDSRL